MGEREFVLGIQGEEPIGVGYEKKVFQHRDNDKVAKLHIDDDTYGLFEQGREGRSKAEFYLTKIVHLLLPKNIPDIHLISHKYKGSVNEKKELGNAHTLMQEFIKNDPKGKSVGIVELNAAQNEIKQALEQSNLLNELHDLGITEIENSVRNYGKDKDGNIVYVDTIHPWEASHASRLTTSPFRPFFSLSKLSTAIEERLQNQELVRARKYLERLRIITENEAEIHKAKQI